MLPSGLCWREWKCGGVGRNIAGRWRSSELKPSFLHACSTLPHALLKCVCISASNIHPAAMGAAVGLPGVQWGCMVKCCGRLVIGTRIDTSVG